jgi:hypothetical protein
MVILRAVLVTTIESAGRSTNLVATTPMLARQIVARNKVITVNFGTEMDASSINTSTFTVKQTD